MSLLEDLTKAYEFHKANGWCKGEWRQGSFVSPHEYEYCMDGAVVYSLMESEKSDDFDKWMYSERAKGMRFALQVSAEQVTGKYYYNVPRFNDHGAKEKADVTKVFEAAVNNLKEKSCPVSKG